MTIQITVEGRNIMFSFRKVGEQMKRSGFRCNDSLWQHQ